MDMKVREQLERDLKWERTVRKGVEKELKGTKILLEEYETELSKLNEQMKAKESQEHLIVAVKENT